MLLGITGGSGSGKTTLLELIRQKGGLVLDCDAIYHQLLQSDPTLLAKIQDRFPGTIENGQLNRKKLGNIVFSDADALAALNAITHQAVKNEVLQRLPENETIVAIDAYGLFEGGLSELCKPTVAVVAPLAARIQRLMARDGVSEAYARSRIAAQKTDAEFSDLCDYTLENDGTVEDFQTKCLAFLQDIGII